MPFHSKKNVKVSYKNKLKAMSTAEVVEESLTFLV